MLKVTVPKELNMLELSGESFYGMTFQKCIQFPDRKRFKNGRFLFLNSFSNIEYAIETFPEASWEGESLNSYNDFKRHKQQEEFTLFQKKEQKQEDGDSLIFKTKPFDHQLKAYNISKDLEAFALLFEQGCGKTKVVLDNACYLYKQGKIEALVIIAPNGVHTNWVQEEIPVHLNCEYEAFVWDGKHSKKNTNRLVEIGKSKKLRVYAFNIDCFVSEKQQQLLVDILQSNKNLLVIDESQKIKNHKAKRTKFFCEIIKWKIKDKPGVKKTIGKILDFTQYRRICTGTPITNGTENIYTQFKFLNPNIIGISSFYVFKSKYCITKQCNFGGNDFEQIVGYKNINDLQNKIQSNSMRVLKKDCLDLPDKMYLKEFFDMSASQRELYNKIRNEGIAMIEKMNPKEPILFDSIMAKMTKLQQVSSGYIIDTDNQKIVYLVENKHNPKLNKLQEIIDSIDGKVIIWTRYIADADMLMQLFGEYAVRYDGQVSREERELNKHVFKTSDKIKFFISNLQVGSTGLTLTEASNCIYFNNSYDLEMRSQSEARIDRIGATKSIFYHDLICNGTNDRKIIRALVSKKKISDMVLQDPKSFFIEE